MPKIIISRSLFSTKKPSALLLGVSDHFPISTIILNENKNVEGMTKVFEDMGVPKEMQSTL